MRRSEVGVVTWEKRRRQGVPHSHTVLDADVNNESPVGYYRMCLRACVELIELESVQLMRGCIRWAYMSHDQTTSNWKHVRVHRKTFPMLSYNIATRVAKVSTGKFSLVPKSLSIISHMPATFSSA